MTRFDRPWSAEEIARLTEMREAGKASPEIAKALNRSQLAVKTKAQKLHLPNHYQPTPPASPHKPHAPAVPRAGKTTLPPLASLHD